MTHTDDTRVDSTMIERHPEVPEFAVAMRGYDRLQVDEYVGHLHDLVSEAEARRTASEAALAEQGTRLDHTEQRIAELEHELDGATPAAVLDDATDRVGAAVSGALESCRLTHDAARENAVNLVEEARGHAARIVEAAREAMADLEHVAREDRRAASAAFEEARSAAEAEAELITENASADAARIVAEAERHREEVLAEADERHRAALAELERLREEKESALEQLGALRAALERLITEPVGMGEHDDEPR